MLHCRDEAAQAELVCDRVLQAREEGSLLRAQAVLMRTSHDSDLLELELARRRVPFVKYGGLRYLEAAHVKDFVALLRLADNGATSSPGSACCSSSRAWAGVRAQGDRRAGAGLAGGAGSGAGGGARPADALVAAIGRRARSAARASRAETLRDALAPLVKARYPDGALRLADLDQLVAAAREAQDARHFVAELVLDPPQSSADLAQPPRLDDDYLVL